MIRLLARLLARPAVVDWLIRRAVLTPYVHITGPDGTVYMERYWLFNPYDPNTSGGWRALLPSVRLHRIWRQDGDRHMHDHPWNARTFILRGWYIEDRLERPYRALWDFTKVRAFHLRHHGVTATLRFGEYHQITEVSPDGVWTLFVTGKKRGTWGFLVDGAKVNWRTYLGIEK